jgi:hypothetical protein
MTHACSAARNSIWRGIPLHESENPSAWCDPDTDVARLVATTGNYRAFAKQKFKSIDVTYVDGGENFSASDAKALVGLKWIVVLVGASRSHCEMTMVPISEEQPPRGQIYE